MTGAGPGPPPSPRAPAPPRRSPLASRMRLVVALIAVVLVVVVLVAVLAGKSSIPAPPAAGRAASPAVNAFDYDPALEAQFADRAAAGNAQALYVKSPGGVLATAARVAAWRGLIDRAVAGTNIDPNLLEGLVFVESAGRPDVIAGSSLADAAGLTQILAQTGQSLLGMHIDLALSTRLTAQIDRLSPNTQHAVFGVLLARREAADPRFNPAAELAATVRYLEDAEREFGREDLAFESYHMGIGNLHQVLTDYNGGTPVPYAQLYFDVAPDRHPAAYDLLASFGDDSSLYYWRILAAVQIMHLWRTDRAALRRLSSLQTADDAGAAALDPPATTTHFATPAALATAYQHREVVPLPSNAAQLGLAVNPQMGAGASKLGAPESLYRGLRPVAERMLIEIAAGVRTLSGVNAPLHVFSTVSDARYQYAQDSVYPPATTGYSFAITRRYANGAQADAFQAMLDRLESLDLIAWAREPSVIEVTVSPAASSWRP